MNPTNEIFAAWPHAIIYLEPAEGGATMRRPAAHVFQADRGFAWVEPQYTDPAGAATPALHYVRATTIEGSASGGYTFSGPRWRGFVVPYEDSDATTLGPAIERYREWLAEQKKTVAAERAEVWDMIAEGVQELAAGPD